MRKAAKRRRTEQLHLRLAPGELMLIRKNAESLGMTVSEYVRTCVRVFEVVHGEYVRGVMERVRGSSVYDALGII